MDRPKEATARNKKIVRRYLEDAWAKGNISMIDELVSADFSFSVTPFISKELIGPEKAKRVASFVRNVFPDLRIEILQEIATDENVVIFWKSEGTYLGEWEEGIKPTGKLVEWKGISIYSMQAGKITKEEVLEDGLGLLYQLGALHTWKP